MAMPPIPENHMTESAEHYVQQVGLLPVTKGGVPARARIQISGSCPRLVPDIALAVTPVLPAIHRGIAGEAPGPLLL